MSRNGKARGNSILCREVYSQPLADTSTPERQMLLEMIVLAIEDAIEYKRLLKRQSVRKLNSQQAEDLFHIKKSLKFFISDNPRMMPILSLKTICQYLFNCESSYQKIRDRIEHLIKS